jgi:hypothetical protein
VGQRGSAHRPVSRQADHRCAPCVGRPTAAYNGISRRDGTRRRRTGWQGSIVRSRTSWRMKAGRRCWRSSCARSERRGD